MARKNNIAKPTAAELSLLRVLWEKGPSTVRQIHESAGGDTGYTTTLKILQKMAVKGLVVRDETERTHVYAPAHQAEETQRSLVGDLLNSAFGGKPGKLVVQALSQNRASAEELAEIRRLLDLMESKNSTKSRKRKEPKHD